MLVTLSRNGCIVERNYGPKIYSESLLFAKIRDELKKQGYDVIKKRPAKDGHLTSAPYYIRDRNGNWAITDGLYAIRTAYKDYNNGKLILRVFGDVDMIKEKL